MFITKDWRFTVTYQKLPYILESNPHEFLPISWTKTKLDRGSNPHQWQDDGEDKDDSDWVTDNDLLWVMTASLMNNKL